MNTRKADYLVWNVPRTDTYYRLIAITIVLAILFLPGSNNPWFEDGERLDFEEDAAVTLVQRGAGIFMRVTSGEVELEKLRKAARERFGPDAVIVETEEENTYRIKLGAFDD